MEFGPESPRSSVSNMVFNDAYCHFLSTRFFEALGREGYLVPVSTQAVAELRIFERIFQQR